MKLTPSNSPKISFDSIKRDNARWRKAVKKHAEGLSREQLREYIRQTSELLDRTENIAVGMTERARLEILEKVLERKGK